MDESRRNRAIVQSEPFSAHSLSVACRLRRENKFQEVKSFELVRIKKISWTETVVFRFAKRKLS